VQKKKETGGGKSLWNTSSFDEDSPDAPEPRVRIESPREVLEIPRPERHVVVYEVHHLYGRREVVDAEVALPGQRRRFGIGQVGGVGQTSRPPAVLGGRLRITGVHDDDEHRTALLLDAVKGAPQVGGAVACADDDGPSR
jgi:hypothetical protein